MPIYEFICDACEHEFESLQRLSDPLPDACPNCGKNAVKKKVSAAGFRLKGGGWYETDFKSGQKKNVSGTSTDQPGTDSAGPDASAGSDKPATGSDDSATKSTGGGSKEAASPAKTGSPSPKKD